MKKSPKNKNTLVNQENWPTEVLNSYNALKLPSLWDFLVLQEKHGLDISEIKEILESIKLKLNQMNSDLSIFDMSHEMEPLSTDQIQIELEKNTTDKSISLPSEYSSWEVNLLKQNNQAQQEQWEEAYLAIYEQHHKLIEDQKELLHETLTFFEISTKSRRKEKRNFLLFMEEKLERAQTFENQLLTHLIDHNISVINPKPGEIYNEQVHRLINEISFNSSHPNSIQKIHEVVHCGYYRDEILIKKADVITYKEDI